MTPDLLCCVFFPSCMCASMCSNKLFASMRQPDGFCAACWLRNDGGVARLLRCEALSAAEGTEECRGGTCRPEALCCRAPMLQRAFPTTQVGTYYLLHAWIVLGKEYAGSMPLKHACNPVPSRCVSTGWGLVPCMHRHHSRRLLSTAFLAVLRPIQVYGRFVTMVTSSSLQHSCQGKQLNKHSPKPLPATPAFTDPTYAAMSCRHVLRVATHTGPKCRVFITC